MVRRCYEIEGSMYALCATLIDFPLAGRSSLYRAVGESGLPTMLVWGDDDRVTPIARLAEARSLLSPAHVELVADCGHMVPFEEPERAAAAFAGFIHSKGT